MNGGHHFPLQIEVSVCLDGGIDAGRDPRTRDNLSLIDLSVIAKNVGLRIVLLARRCGCLGRCCLGLGLFRSSFPSRHLPLGRLLGFSRGHWTQVSTMVVPVASCGVVPFETGMFGVIVPKHMILPAVPDTVV
jgi:hypothetical protein